MSLILISYLFFFFCNYTLKTTNKLLIMFYW